MVSKPAFGAWLIVLIGCAMFFPPSPLSAQVSIDPLLVFERTEFELGAPIVFFFGRKTPGLMDAIQLMAAACELSVLRPDGTKAYAKETNGFAVYDGPSRVGSLGSKALLNDLVRLTEGNYRVAQSCGAKVVAQEIVIKRPAVLEKLSISFVFPQAVDLFGSEPVKVAVTVTNGLDRLVRIVAPGANRSAGVAMALSIPTIPAIAWFPMSSSESAGSAISALLPITRPNLEKLNVVSLGPGESFSTNLTFNKDSIQRFTEGDRIRAEEFQLQAATIVPIILDGLEGDQPVMHAYRQSGVCYDRIGRRNDLGCRLSSLDWASHLPYDLPTN